MNGVMTGAKKPPRLAPVLSMPLAAPTFSPPISIAVAQNGPSPAEAAPNESARTTATARGLVRLMPMTNQRGTRRQTDEGNDAPPRFSAQAFDQPVRSPSPERRHDHPGDEGEACVDRGLGPSNFPDFAKIVINPEEKNIFKITHGEISDSEQDQVTIGQYATPRGAARYAAERGISGRRVIASRLNPGLGKLAECRVLARVVAPVTEPEAG